jgi:RimJ/RimL family protein N-acetyltransferase
MAVYKSLEGKVALVAGATRGAGRGIATELGAASIEIAFGPLALPDVVSFTLPHNHGSRRVMEKLGFAYERDTDYKGWPHVLYRLTASARAARLG